MSHCVEGVACTVDDCFYCPNEDHKKVSVISKEKQRSIEIKHASESKVPLIKQVTTLETYPCTNLSYCKENMRTTAWGYQQPACICKEIFTLLENKQASFF